MGEMVKEKNKRGSRKRAALAGIVSLFIAAPLLFSPAGHTQPTAPPTATGTPLPLVPLVLMKDEGGDHNLYGYNVPVAGDWTYWDAAARNPSPLARDLWLIPEGNNAVVMAEVDAGDGGGRELAILKADSGSDQNLYLYNIPFEGDWTYWSAAARNPSSLARDLWMLPAGNDTALIADGASNIAAMEATGGDYNLYLYGGPVPGDWTYWDAAARNPSALSRDLWVISQDNDAWAMCGLDTTGDGESDSLLVVRNTWGDYSVCLWNMPAAGDWTYADAVARNPSARARDFWSIPMRNAIVSVTGVGRGSFDELVVMENEGGDHNVYVWNAPRPGDWTYWDAAARNPSALARDLWQIPAGNGTVPVPMKRGEPDPNLHVALYKPEKVWPGTTLLSDTHDDERPRIIEVNMLGEIVWEYLVPEDLKQYTNPGFDTELLPNGNILFLLPSNGIYEIDRDGAVVWSHLDPKVSHDADRLPDGNTLYIFGNDDQIYDPQVKEVNPDGEIVWSWSARDHLYYPPYMYIYRQGWTPANAVTRLANGNTVINLRNFDLTVEVNPPGSVVWSFDWNSFGDHVDPHEPEVLTDNNMVIALQNDSPYQSVEIDRDTGETLWTFSYANLRTTRDADRLPNGNTLLVGVIEGEEESTVLEVTPGGEVVWQLTLINTPAVQSPGWFYKAQRIGLQR